MSNEDLEKEDIHEDETQVDKDVQEDEKEPVEDEKEPVEDSAEVPEEEQEMVQKAKDLLNKIKDDVSQDEEVKAMYQRARNIVEPTLKRLTTAAVKHAMLPEGGAKNINKDILKSARVTLENCIESAEPVLKNYAIEKFSKVLKDVVLDYIFRIVLSR